VVALRRDESNCTELQISINWQLQGWEQVLKGVL
jgi:hypothetical protein